MKNHNDSSNKQVMLIIMVINQWHHIIQLKLKKHAKRNYWSGEVRRLIDYTRSIQKPTNSVNRTAFNVARDEFDRAKEEYSKIKQEFDEAKEIHENNLNNFNRCKDELSQAKKAVDDYSYC